MNFSTLYVIYNRKLPEMWLFDKWLALYDPDLVSLCFICFPWCMIIIQSINSTKDVSLQRLRLLFVVGNIYYRTDDELYQPGRS